MGNNKCGNQAKRIFRKQFKSKRDVYITSKSNFETQLKYCKDIFNTGEKDIYLHCMGSSINRCLNLALHIIKNYGQKLSYSIHTSTIQLIDEAHPLLEYEDIALRTRNNSAVHIKLSRHITE
ncbi:ribonuclease P protein subunit p20 [Zeugodacus cucurbitae]|uniref:ribonuclease P protein subunit p20 n=1 Tax=Zeugodacus cucurbitae TaxID=28588 RepID=UPI0023D91A51|nr:ribonuclease P protein subunit p20 [Zeugodacus cucurbitae]